MPSLITPIRTAAAVAVLAVATTVGAASASATTHKASKSHSHHVAKTDKHRRRHDKTDKHRRRHDKTDKHRRHHHKKTHKAAVPAHAASASSRKKLPTKTTPSKTTPSKTTPSKTTPSKTTPTTTTSTTAPTDPTTSNGTPQPVGISGSWNLVLDSEFDGSSLDTSIWQPGWYGSTGFTGPVNSNESACYSPSNVTFPGDGTMHLNVTHTSSTCGGVTEPWTGSIVTTNPDDGRATGGFQYTYGVAEARVYIPANGTKIANWPAFWADGQSWPADGEDDVLEAINGGTCSTFHDPLGDPDVCDNLITPGWHTFASDWQPGSVTYYYDGVDVGTVTTGITSSPMFLILDNTTDGEYASNNAADAMQVQYVRVWQSA